MITVNLFGGLGNQLFQIAAAYKISQIKNKKITIDNSLQNYFKFSHKKFNLSDIFKLNFKKKKNNNFYQILLKKIILKFRFLSNFQGFYVTESNYLKTLKKDFTEIEMLDYWQNLDFFKSHIDEIKKLLKFKYIKVDKNLLNIISIKNSVSLHIRRGDYISSKNYVNYSLPIEYYEKAIKKISQKRKNLIFFIFSDDKKWVKNNFLKKFKKFDLNLVSTDKSYKDFFLMTKCKHHIISNSTFSWWSAFLNKNNEKLIIYPSVWFKNKLKPPAIFDDKWIKV
jgi:hypothetical protein